MMSDEEKQGDVFIRHQPSYRSTKLIKFLDKLDKRSAQKVTHQPRTNRQLGSPVKKEIPPTCKEWMIKPELRKRRDKGVKEFYRMFKRSASRDWLMKYKSLRNRVTILIRSAKKSFFEKMACATTNSMMKTKPTS